MTRQESVVVIPVVFKTGQAQDSFLPLIQVLFSGDAIHQGRLADKAEEL